METNLALRALRTAVPYIRAYKGRVFVIKLGGGLCEPGVTLEGLVDQVAVLHQLGVKVVLVHGGGEQASALSTRLGMTPQIVDGRRITDRDTLEVAKMTFAGTVNSNILAAFRKARVPAIGLSGVDGALITAHRRPVRQHTDSVTGKTNPIDYGFVGDVDYINVGVLDHLLTGEFVPVICSLAADATGQIYNVNADTVASKIAVEVHAAKYFSVTTVDGVLNEISDPSSLVSYVDVDELEALIKSGVITGGMLPKLAACIAALRGGVPRVHIINGTVPDTMLCEVFTNEGCGTLIVPQRERVRSPEPETAFA